MASTNTTPSTDAQTSHAHGRRVPNTTPFDRWSVWLGLFSFAVVVLRCFFIARWQIQCPSHWPVSIGIVGFAVAMLWQVTTLIQAMHSKRGRMIAWGRVLFLVTPLLLSTWGIVHVSRITSVRYIPDALPLRLVGPFVVSLFDIESSWRFPNVYNGARISMMTEKPMEGGHALVTEAEKFLEDLERKLGRKGSDRARWVRGSLLGRNNFQVLGWIMSDFYAAENVRGLLTELDKHEIAHFAIHQFLGTQRMPPTFLIEGWAQTCSTASENIASQAYDARYQAGQVWSISSLTASPWRSLDKGPAYTVGAAWVSYLCETIGSKSFGDLFIRSGDEDFLQLASDILKKDITDIERDVWDWVERTRISRPIVKLENAESNSLLTSEEWDAWSSARTSIRPTLQKIASETGGVYWKETIVSADESSDNRTREMTREYWIFPMEKWMFGEIFFRDKPVLFALLANGETLALEKTSQGWVTIDDMKGITDIRDYTSQFFIQSETSFLSRTIDDYLHAFSSTGWDLQSKETDERGNWQIVMQNKDPFLRNAELVVDPRLDMAVRELHLKTTNANDTKTVEANVEHWVHYEKDELLGVRVVSKRTRQDWGKPEGIDDAKISFEWKTGEEARMPVEFQGLTRYSVPYTPHATTPLEILIALSAASSFVVGCFCVTRNASRNC